MSTHIKSYKDHPCNRPCNSQTISMICEYDWTIEWYSVLSKACLDCPFNMTNCNQDHCITANGVYRPVMVINRMLPGPSIIACKGDTINIMLFNSLHMSEATSIHWHGLSQRGSQFMDGVGMITQCPILSHTFFEYKFAANDAGTHLYHAHSGLQRADGVFGPIVIRDYDHENVHFEKYDYDLSEHVITVNDWLNDTSIAKFSGHHHNDGDNKPDSILINGKGALRHVDYKNLSIETPRAEFWVRSGKKYRFRLINAGILYCPIEFSIDYHNLTIIASDGKPLEPYTVESLIIYAGERYDFIINAFRKPSNYWIKAKGWADCSVKKVYQTAFLKYHDSFDKDNLPDLNELNYENASRNGLQLNPWNKHINSSNRDSFTKINEVKAILDKESYEFYTKIFDKNQTIKKYYLAMEFNKINNPEFYDEKLYSLSKIQSFQRPPLYTPQINNISMKMPSIPLLYEWDSVPKDEICNHINRSHVCPVEQEYCSCIYTFEFNLGDVVEFVIVDEGFTFQSNHPMHLHGGSFAVLNIDKLNRSISVEDIKKMDNEGKIYRSFDRPPIKDTVTVPVGGYTIIRFLADNPGTWMFHCHLDFHSEVGMGLLIKVGQKKDLPSEPLNWPKCGNYFYIENDKPVSVGTNSSNKIFFSLFNFVLLVFYVLIDSR
ncbi:unnamed protein product [Brachionus calyciflorus]|uniref:L-ascorbate oxidase n=1 Tax=Brachionus calyciflorus TaxID=104777 RepID=A0A813M754_9BILA|nr:unnamed protein product [Brachionus calyciflorus]